MTKRWKAAVASVAAAVAVAGVGAWLLWRGYVGIGYDGAEAVRVNIPRGVDADSVAAILGRDLGTAGRRAAQLWRLNGSSAAVAHGSYRVAPGERAIDVARRVACGQQTPVRLTFNNLRLVEQLAGRIGRTLEADSAEVMAAIDSVLASQGYAPEEYVGAFLPDTYEFYWTARPADVVAALTAVRNRFWEGARTARAAALGLTPKQAAVIASIAEEETTRADERGAVGRLYLNRLQRGMPLQADPTVKYALGNFALRRITAKHLAVDSRYNTYKYAGLPPGPIRMPERATIDSLLGSRPHDFLYMCASADFNGRHLFARDLATHLSNAAAYHRALNRRGIR